MLSFRTSTFKKLGRWILLAVLSGVLGNAVYSCIQRLNGFSWTATPTHVHIPKYVHGHGRPITLPDGRSLILDTSEMVRGVVWTFAIVDAFKAPKVAQFTFSSQTHDLFIIKTIHVVNSKDSAAEIIQGCNAIYLNIYGEVYGPNYGNGPIEARASQCVRRDDPNDTEDFARTNLLPTVVEALKEKIIRDREENLRTRSRELDAPAPPNTADGTAYRAISQCLPCWLMKDACRNE